MKNEDKNVLVKNIIYSRILLAVSLIKSENKEEYLKKILNIKFLTDIEKYKWECLYKCFTRTGNILKADIVRIFNLDQLNIEFINKLLSCDDNDEIDSYFKIYENVMKYTDLFYTLGNLRKKLFNEGIFDGNEIIQKMHNITNAKSVNVDILTNLENIYDEAIDMTKISTCIKQIDDLNAEFRKGTVNAVMGYTGSYKTLYCTNVCYGAIKKGINTCYVSLEISTSEMYYNFLSRYSNEAIFDRKICHTDIKFKELSDDDKNYLFHTIVPSFKEELSKHLVVIDETNFSSNTLTTFDDIFSTVETNFIKTTGRGVDLVVIDHLNLLKFSDSSGMNDYSKVNHWMSYFRRNCMNFLKKHKQVCILVAVQCSRDGYERAKRNGGTYSLTGVAEANEVERASENVLAIYSDCSLKEHLKAKIQIIKGRNCGETSTPLMISVNPKYYIVSDNDEDEENLDNDLTDVTAINKKVNLNDKKADETTIIQNEDSNINFSTLMSMDNSMSSTNLNIPPEKAEILEKLGVHFLKNQNQ